MENIHFTTDHVQPPRAVNCRVSELNRVFNSDWSTLHNHTAIAAITLQPRAFHTHSIKMATLAPTIIDLKLNFLSTQILALSTPLSPSTSFITSNASAEENALRQKSIDEALYKLNGLLKKHNRLAYGPQAKRHVAEQVDRLFWNAGERGVHGGGEEWAERGTDYRELTGQLFSEKKG
jgi:hypothetical protein